MDVFEFLVGGSPQSHSFFKTSKSLYSHWWKKFALMICMKKWLFLGLLMWGFALWMGVGVGKTTAEGACGAGQTCYGTRNVTAYICGALDGSYCQEYGYMCINIPGQSCTNSVGDCNDPHGSIPDCKRVCTIYVSILFATCKYQNESIGCSTNNATYCQASGNIYTCSSAGSSCSETSVLQTYGCCGPGGSDPGGPGDPGDPGDPLPPPPTGTPTPSNSPIGWHDTSTCVASTGWTCDADNYSQSLWVYFYMDGPAGTGTFLGQTLANTTRGAAVAANCGGVATHGFSFPTPAVAKDGLPHTIYAYALNIPSGPNVLLSGSPLSVTCPAGYTVSGRVYLDNSGTCSDTSQPLQPGVGSTVSTTGYSLASVAANGTWSMPSVAVGTRVFSLNMTDSQYSCVCPGGCVQSVTVDGIETGVNYFVSNVQNSWWQTVGGDVGAHSGTMTSAIPATCIGPGCLPFVTRQLPAMIDSAGVLWIGGVASSFGAAGADFSENTDYRAYGTSYRTSTKREGYNYFYRLYEMGINPVEDPVLSGSEGNMPKPSGIPANERAFFVRAGDGTGTVTIDQVWNVGAGESVVVFVDGDLTVNQPSDVAVGGFLALIVNGDIVFQTDTAEGVFVADGQIVTRG